MDPRKVRNAIGVLVEVVDLADLEAGQWVELVMEDGSSVCVSRLDATQVTGDADYGAERAAVWGKDVELSGPAAHCTRRIRTGQRFKAIGNGADFEAAVSKIVLPVKPE